MKYLFELTSLARADGSLHGMLRQEQQLGLRARRHLGDDLAFVFHSRMLSAYFALPDGAAEAILNGELRLDDARPAAKPLQSTRAPISRVMDRLRFGSSGRRDASRAADAPVTGGSRRIPFESLALQPVELGPASVVIARGIDWEYKDVVGMVHDKWRRGYRYCGACHDTFGVDQPHFFLPGYAELFETYFRALFTISDLVLVSSDYVRRQVDQFCETRGLPKPTIRTFPMGAVPFSANPHRGSDRAALDALGLTPGHFVLYVSMLSPRKNHAMLYRAWLRALESLDRQHPPKLVFVGRTGWGVDDLLVELRENPVARQTVIHIQDAEDDLLARLYAEAACTVFPSLDEGYGIPVGEALAAGKLVLASSRGAIPELFGQHCILIDPIDGLGWAANMARFLDDPSLREAQRRELLRGHAAPTWDAAAETFFHAVKAHYSGLALRS